MLLTEVPKIWQQWADIQCRARTALLLALKPVDDLSSVEIYLEIALFFGRDFALKMETSIFYTNYYLNHSRIYK